MDRLAEVAADLLRTDGIAVIWQAHITAARANRDGHPRAAEILLKIADAAEEAVQQALHSTDCRAAPLYSSLLAVKWTAIALSSSAVA